MENSRFLIADFRGGYVYINGKRSPAGSYAVHLLNQYYQNDTALRIAVCTCDFWMVQRAFETGYINHADFMETGRRISRIFDELPKLKPLHTLDLQTEKERTTALFTEENYKKIYRYFHDKAKVMSMDESSAFFHIPEKARNKKELKQGQALVQDVLDTLTFYLSISDDMDFAFTRLRKFAAQTHEAERFDEGHLLPLALEAFGPAPFSAKTEYIGLRGHGRATTRHTARRLYFDSYRGFILTDFFEGLRHGHYPKQCEICKKYFLMTSARKQRYCDGMSPYYYNGKRLSCRQCAAVDGRKELAEGNPVIDIYNRRCACIRAELSRKKISKEFSDQAKQIAAQLKFEALKQEEYTLAEYKRDMGRTALYARVEQRMKQ